MNWTADSWTREENVILTVDSGELAARYAVDFDQLWTQRDVRRSGKVDSSPIVVDGVSVRHGSVPAGATSSPTGSRRRSERRHGGCGSRRP